MYSCKLPLSGSSTQDQAQTGPKPQVNTRRSLLKKKNFLRWSSLPLHRLLTVVHRLSCQAARGIFPDQGSNPCPLHWQADSHPLSHQRSPWADPCDTTPGTLPPGVFFQVSRPRKDKTQARLMDGFVHYAGTTSKQTVAALHPHSGWHWKTEIKENPLVAITSSSIYGCSLFGVWDGQKNRSRLIQRHLPMICLDDQEFKRHRIVTLVKKKAGEEVYGWTTWVRLFTIIVVFHMNAHQKASAALETLKQSGVYKWHALWMSPAASSSSCP